LRRAQVEAVIGSDVGAAFALQQELDRARDGLLNPLRLDHDLAADSLDEGQSRLADAVSARLLADIRRRERAPGATIGTLQNLSEQYGVSLGVLRAVIRRLEHVGAVRMEAGRSGGLQVATPAPQQTIASAILYINCARPSLPDIVATQEALELAAITLAAQSGDVIAPQLGALTEPVLPPAQALHDFGRSHFLTLVEASGNRVLLLLIRILAAQMSAQHFMMQQPSPQAVFNDYLRQFRRIVAAIQDGDVALARRGAIDLHRFITGLELRQLSPDELQSADS
jgi:DNA-binding FadR family transcriptional regulator